MKCIITCRSNGCSIKPIAILRARAVGLKKKIPRAWARFYVTAEMVRQAAILLQPVIRRRTHLWICWIAQEKRDFAVWVPIACFRNLLYPPRRGVSPLSIPESGGRLNCCSIATFYWLLFQKGYSLAMRMAQNTSMCGGF